MTFLRLFINLVFLIIWVKFVCLYREISGAPKMSPTMTTSSDSPASAAVGTKKDVHTTASEMQNQLLHEADMNAAQRRRFRYFQQMRVFVTNLTNICERLRYVVPLCFYLSSFSQLRIFL